jgi:allophanate hydrolase
VLSIIEGPDASDSYSQFETGPSQLKPVLRVGIPSQPVFSGDAGYRALFAKAAAHVQALGHEVVPIDFSRRCTPPPSCSTAALGGRAARGRAEAARPRPHGLRPRGAQHRRKRAAASRPPTPFAASTSCALHSAMRRPPVEQVDVLMVPTATGHPSMAEVAADPIGANARLGAYTNFVNLLGWSALALPSASPRTACLSA